VIMKEVFDKHYKEKFAAKGLLKKTGGWASSARPSIRRVAVECAGTAAIYAAILLLRLRRGIDALSRRRRAAAAPHLRRGDDADHPMDAGECCALSAVPTDPAVRTRSCALPTSSLPLSGCSVPLPGISAL
jgi:hypothetical protein